MFLQRNQASQTFVIPGTLRAAADGTAVTSGATLTWVKDGTSAASAGTLTHVSDGGYTYQPTQGETDAKICGWVLSKTGAVGLAGSLRTTNGDPNDGTRLGLTALPNVAAGAVGGLPLGVDASGRVDVLKVNGTSQTARDLGASVLLSSGTGTGQLDFTSGVVKANATQWLGGTIAAVNVTGVPKVDVVDWLGTAPLALSSQQVQAVVPDAQKVDVNTIKTQTVTCAAGVTVSPFVGSTGAAVNGTNANTLSSHDPGATLGTSTLTQTQVTGGAYSIQSASCVLGDARVAHLDADVSSRATATGVWDLATSGHTTSGTFGAAMNAAGSAGDPWATTVPGAYGAGTAGFILGTNLNATVTSRMATYTQPTGFLAATFPSGTVANTTNITGGTITTATNLTNAPTSGDFTAAMKTSLNNSTPASVTGSVGSVAGDVGGSVLGSVIGNVGGVDSIVTASVTTDGLTRASFAVDTGLQSVRSGTCQAGSTSSTVKLDSGASATDNFYQWLWVKITGGTGAGQTRLVASYVGSTKVATLARNWTTTPDGTSTFALLDAAGVDVEAWRASVPNALISGRVDANAGVVPGVDVVTINGDGGAAVGLAQMGNDYGADGTLNADLNGRVLNSVASVATGGIAAASFAADAVSAAAVSAAAVTKVQAGLATPTNITAATGVALAATGLDAISAAEVTTKPATFARWLMWLVQRFRRADMTATALTVKTEAGAQATQQVLSDDGTTQTLGPPT